MLLKGRNEKWVGRTKAEFAIPPLQPIPQRTKQSLKGEHLKELLFLKTSQMDVAPW